MTLHDYYALVRERFEKRKGIKMERFVPTQVAQEIALKSIEPTREPGRPEWRFDLVDGRPWYVKPNVLTKVRNLDLVEGEYFRVALREYKPGNFVLDVQKLAGQQPSPNNSAAAPRATTNDLPNATPAQVRMVTPIRGAAADAMTQLGELLKYGLPPDPPSGKPPYRLPSRLYADASPVNSTPSAGVADQIPEPPNIPLTDADVPAPRKGAAARVAATPGPANGNARPVPTKVQYGDAFAQFLVLARDAVQSLAPGASPFGSLDATATAITKLATTMFIAADKHDWLIWTPTERKPVAREATPVNGHAAAEGARQ